MWNLFIIFLKNIFSRHNYTVEPRVEISDTPIENPVVTVVVGNKRLMLSTAQARKLFGVLGQHLERLTPDPKEYRP